MALLTDEEKDVDAYKVLDLESSATDKDIQRAYRPEAEAMFRQISLALAMLLDRDKRKFIDTRLEQTRLASARRADMNAKRKAGVDDLVRREEEARRARHDALKRRQEAASEEAVKEDGRRLVEEAQRKAAEAQRLSREADTVSRPSVTTSSQPNITSLDLTLALQLPIASELASLSALEPALRTRYGSIAHVVLRDTPTSADNATGSKKKSKYKGAKAIVEFSSGNWGGCWACWRDHNGEAPAKSPPLQPGIRAKWAGGTEPAWVAWATQQAAMLSSTTTSIAPGYTSAPLKVPAAANDSSQRVERDVEGDREMNNIHSSAFESATLLRMRQLERERLAEQIRREEEAEET